MHHAEREHGESKYSAMRLISLMFDLADLHDHHALAPAVHQSVSAWRHWACCLPFALIVMRLAFGADWAGDGLFVLFAVLFVFTGGQFIGMGLLGEYLGRMYSDVRARPRFFIEKVLRNQPAAPAPVVVVDGLVSSHTSTSSSDQVQS